MVSYGDSEFSDVKSFVVCPMDIDVDGEVSGLDRSFLTRNWLCEVGEDKLTYPKPLANALADAAIVVF